MISLPSPRWVNFLNKSWLLIAISIKSFFMKNLVSNPMLNGEIMRGIGLSFSLSFFICLNLFCNIKYLFIFVGFYLISQPYDSLNQ